MNKSFSISEDIRPVTDLKEHTPEVLDHLRASNLARLLGEGEDDIAAGRTRPLRTFFREFKNAKKISR